MAWRQLHDVRAADRRDHLRWAVRVRWLAIGGFSGLGLLAWQLGVLPAIGPCLGAGAAAAAINGVNHWCVRRGRGLRRVTTLALSADVGLITVLALQTGGARSPFVMLYVVQVVATALLVDLWIAALAALASAGALTTALCLGIGAEPGGAGDDPAAQLVWGLFLLYCLALLVFLGGYIAERLRRSEDDLGVAQAALRGTRQRLRQTEAQLVQSEKLRALGQFVAGIAHELNNPLGFVAANLDWLRRAIAALEATLDAYAAAVPSGLAEATAHGDRERLASWRAELPGVLDDCADGVRRLADIVAALRVFARADRGESWASADLQARLERVLVLVHHRLSPAVVLRRDFAPLPPVECLPGQLDQVFVNVLANAIDAVAGAGTITLRTRLAPPHALVQIADSGRGLDPALRARVFEPFFTTKAEGQGTGLGLAVSYGIVERHGGTIALDPAPGGGTVVTIRLPLQHRPDGEAAASGAGDDLTGSTPAR
ncbi:MAG: ATP-binding protein [Candidatus Binatia bacterium]